MLIAFAPFGGLIPKSDPVAMPTGAAQKALHCRLTAGGILEAYKRPLEVFIPAIGNLRTIYRYGQQANSDTQYWFVSSNEVDFVKGSIANDTEERTYYTGDGFPKMTKSDMATTSSPYPSSYYRLGIPAPAETPTGVVTGSYTDTDIPETRFYVYTFVTALGEESPPSPPSAELTVYPGQSVNLMMGAQPSGAYNVSTRRIYRTSSGSSSTQFLFVAEIPAATQSYDDTILTENLAEPCPTVDSAPLPDDARGLVAMANGIMAAHTDYDVYFSEAFKPYSYPPGYSQTVGYPIVGMGAFGQSLVVLTKGEPYVMSGSDPQSISVEKLPVAYSCMSKKSIVSAMNSVIFAAPDGLVLIDASGPKVLTEALFTRREWNDLNPASMVCAVWDEKIFVFFRVSDSVKGGYILDMQNGLTTTDVYATAAFTDPVTNSLFLAVNDRIVKWDGGTDGVFDWKSRRLNMPVPRNWGYGQVLADTYPVYATVYADGASITADPITVSDDKPFRLPGGFRARYWEMELAGAGRLFMAYLADSAAELQSV